MRSKHQSSQWVEIQTAPPCDVFTDIPTWPNIREVTTVNNGRDIFTDIPTWNNELSKTGSIVPQSHQVDESSKKNHPQTLSEPMAQAATRESCPLPEHPPLINTEIDQNIPNIVNSAGMLAMAEKQNTADTETL
ncbi:hypothetical protein [Endozoicomonas atrinae]|uniref:hypothetical protein n=1 Tax=Endozoicomonas atrinae TaxID=1333660 RepID=UPI003B00098A